MNKYFFAYLRMKKLLQGEAAPLPEDHDAKMILGFVEQCLKPVLQTDISGKFDRACGALKKILEIFDELIKPHFAGNAEWFSALLGIETGLVIAKTQLDFIKQKRG